jgi:hypothetical protein
LVRLKVTKAYLTSFTREEVDKFVNTKFLPIGRKQSVFNYYFLLQGKGPHHEDDYRPSQHQQQQQQRQGGHWDRHSSESEMPEQQQQHERLQQQQQTSITTATTTNSTSAVDESFVPLSASNSKDNFETGSSYSSSSLERYPPATSGVAPAQSTAVASGYEDRRSAEADSGKAGFAAEKAGPLEQSNNLRRSGGNSFLFFLREKSVAIIILRYLCFWEKAWNRRIVSN